MTSIEGFVRKNFAVVVLPLVAVVAALNAQGVGELIGVVMLGDGKDLTTPVAGRRSEAAPAPSGVHATSAAPILARNPFDHLTGPLEQPVPEDAPSDDTVAAVGDPFAAPACDGAEVLVIVASEDPAWSFAAFADPARKSVLLRRGGEVAGHSLVFVGRDRVWLQKDGSLCQAILYGRKRGTVTKTPPAPAPSASSAPAAGKAKPLDPDIKKGIQRVSATEFAIDRGVLDRILENQAELMRQARVVPEQENGKVVGIRLVGVKADSLLTNLGMENGDRLQTINGFEMGNPEKALEAYARLRTADRLTISVNRGGKNMNLDYKIR